LVDTMTILDPNEKHSLSTKAASLSLILLLVTSTILFETCTNAVYAQEKPTKIEGVPCDICVSEDFIVGQRIAVDEARAEAREERREQAILEGRLEACEEISARTVRRERIAWAAAIMTTVASVVLVLKH